MSAPTARAKFVPQSGSQKGFEIFVHFNPATLQYSVTNTLKEEGKGKSKKQHVSKSSAKLTMDLVFDTTHTGADVRLETVRLAKLMEPDEGNSPPVVLFDWGSYSFQGMVDTYKETLEFFSSSGVPLRAAINLGMAQQDKVFPEGPAGKPSPPVVDVPRRPGDSMTDLATRGGDPNATRGLGAMTGEESLRFPGNATQTLSDSVPLDPPSAFASGGAGVGFSAGAGFSAGVSASAGFSAGASASAGFSAGFSASAQIGITTGGGASFGASASYRLTATAGAFNGLRTSSRPQVTSFSTKRLVAKSESTLMATDSGAAFRLGGKAETTGTASLRADVGASADLRARIRFEE